MANYYEVLGVAQTASGAEIKKAYVRLAREKHPDRFSDPAERQRADDFFKDVTAAFNTLSDGTTRRSYDESLSRPAVTSPEDMARDAFGRGLKALDAREPQMAAELLRAAAHLAPSEHRYHAALSRALVAAAGAGRESMQAIEAALRLAPTHVPYLVQLAQLQVAQGLKLRARKTLEQARLAAPDDPDVAKLWEQVAAAEPAAPEPKPAGGGLKDLFRRRS